MFQRTSSLDDLWTSDWQSVLFYIRFADLETSCLQTRRGKKSSVKKIQIKNDVASKNANAPEARTGVSYQVSALGTDEKSRAEWRQRTRKPCWGWNDPSIDKVRMAPRSTRCSVCWLAGAGSSPAWAGSVGWWDIVGGSSLLSLTLHLARPRGAEIRNRI